MDWPIGSLLAAKSTACLVLLPRYVRRLQAEARLLAELDALKREQQADGARIKQEVRRGANVTAVRCDASVTADTLTVAQHSTAQQRRPTD